MGSYIKDNFGSRRGFYCFWKARVLQWFGYWQPYMDFPFSEVKRLIFICNGNICRSPLAVLVAREAGYPAESFGLDCTRGAKADPRAIQFANDNGLDLSRHRARPLGDYDPEGGDLLIGMEERHIEAPKMVKGENTFRTLLGLWGAKPCAYMHDPFNSNPAYFEKCEKDVIKRTRNLLQNLPSGQKA